MVYNIFSLKNKKSDFTAYEFHASFQTKSMHCRPIVSASVMLKSTSNSYQGGKIIKLGKSEKKKLTFIIFKFFFFQQLLTDLTIFCVPKTFILNAFCVATSPK